MNNNSNIDEMKFILKYYTMKHIRRYTLLKQINFMPIDHFINSIYKFNSNFIK